MCRCWLQMPRPIAENQHKNAWWLSNHGAVLRKKCGRQVRFAYARCEVDAGTMEYICASKGRKRTYRR